MMKMDWFDSAREFKRLTSHKLSSTGFVELEHQEIPRPFNLPAKIAIQPLEIPSVYRVQDAYHGESALSYFMDGVQRTVLWKYYELQGFLVPIFLHFSGAVIMHRKHADEFIPYDALYRHKLLVPTVLYEEYEGIDDLVDTEAENIWDFNEIRRKALIKSRTLRQEIEQDLMHRFIAKNSSDILLKDGNIFGSMKSERVVGLIKTHNTLYLQEAYPYIQQRVWSMPEFYRSMVFSMQLQENGSPSHRVNSFYLRIHEPHNPEEGLLRIEYNKSAISADVFSSWLIAERYIRAQSSRWDRQIYPIQICEDYLRTHIPSPNHLKAVLQAP